MSEANQNERMVMVVTNNKFVGYYHHGFVAKAAQGYFEDMTLSGNQVVSAPKTGDLSGGWTLGYNYHQWLHNVTIENNTFDTGNRSIYFNDTEGTVVLGTKLKIRNNNLTNAYYGIYLPTGNASNQTSMQIEHMDYNNEYGFTAASNVKQATFKMGGNLYLSDSGNVTGVALYNPSDAPNATGRALALTVGSGSATLSWGGGTPVQIVDDAGTSTAGDATTLTDTSKTWGTNAHRTKYLRITSGTATGQIYMIHNHTSNRLDLISNLAAPVSLGAGVSYEIIKSETTLTDSGANTVQAGIYLPELPTVSGTYTDSGITIEQHGTAVDPQYVDAPGLDFTPLNVALKGVGYGGVDIGAVAVRSAVKKILRKPLSLAIKPGLLF